MGGEFQTHLPQATGNQRASQNSPTQRLHRHRIRPHHGPPRQNPLRRAAAARSQGHSRQTKHQILGKTGAFKRPRAAPPRTGDCQTGNHLLPIANKRRNDRASLSTFSPKDLGQVLPRRLIKRGESGNREVVLRLR